MGKFEINSILLLGIFLLLGWGAHVIGRRFKLPRVTILLLIGMIAGPSLLDVFPHKITNWFPDIAHIALAMVGFLLGESFIGREIKVSGRTILYISIGKTIVAAILVFTAVLLIQKDWLFALLLSGIAPASAPAAILDVIHEIKSRGPLTKTILGVVAIDDAWGVLLFSFLLTAAETIYVKGHIVNEVLFAIWDIGGAILLGVIIGLPMALLTGRIKKGEPSLLEAFGFVMLCGGLALMLNVSYLLSCMVLGVTVANRAKHHTRPFRDIEGASELFLVIFFLLAGYEFELSSFWTLGFIGGIYIIARSVGFLIGGYFAARIANSAAVIKKRIGWCLFPQAGVAMGLALLSLERFPEVGKSVIQLIVGTTIIFELVGPMVTRWHLHKAGEF